MVEGGPTGKLRVREGGELSVVLNSFLMILGEDLLKLNKFYPGFVESPIGSVGGENFTLGCLNGCLFPWSGEAR